MNVYDSQLFMTANQCCTCQRFGGFIRSWLRLNYSFRYFAVLFVVDIVVVVVVIVNVNVVVVALLVVTDHIIFSLCQ